MLKTLNAECVRGVSNKTEVMRKKKKKSKLIVATYMAQHTALYCTICMLID